MAEVVAPLRLFLEELMAGAARRTKRVAKHRAIPPAAWTEGRFKALADAQDLVAHAVTLYHPRPGCQVLMFPEMLPSAIGVVLSRRCLMLKWIRTFR